MFEKTKAIILKAIKYTDNSIIVNSYTEKFGKLSFLQKGIRNKKSKVKINYFQPLNILEIDFKYNPNKNIQYIKEIHSQNYFYSIYSNQYKSSIAIFIAEIINKIIREEEPNKLLFQFADNSINYLENCTENFKNFHIEFLVYLSKYLGFFPKNNHSVTNPFFSLENGCFVHKNQNSYTILSQKESQILNHILSNDLKYSSQIIIKGIERTNFLSKIIDYYKIHLNITIEIKSHKIFNEIYT